MTHTHHNYNLQVTFRPTDYGAVRSAEHVALTHRLTRELRDLVAEKVTSLVVNPGPLNVPEQPWVGSVQFVAAEKNVAWDVHRWVLSRVRAALPEAFVSMEASAVGASIVQARWVPLNSDWYNVERGKTYGSPANRRTILCAKCGWQDFHAIPEPFYVDACISTAGRNEFLPATDGVFIVSARVRDLLLSLAQSDLKTGPVLARGKKPPEEEYFWIRPIHRIGGLLGHLAAGERCPECGTPERLGRNSACDEPPLPLARIVEHFGDTAWNLALVGDEPMGERSRMLDQGVTWNVAISGGLFAALWNHAIKGLKWPQEGPYISRRADEDTWERSRRFGDLVPSGGDKALKHKPKR